jgi:hypothetical protein
LICVARVDGPFAIALVQAKLGGAGIWSSVDMFHMATNHSHYAVAFGGAKIEVLEYDAEEAAALLEDGPPLVCSVLRGWCAQCCAAGVHCWQYSFSFNAVPVQAPSPHIFSATRRRPDWSKRGNGPRMGWTLLRAAATLNPW